MTGIGDVDFNVVNMELTCGTVLVYAMGIYFLSLTKANVVVFSVYDVLVELDTFGHISIRRTNISEWKYQGSDEDPEVFLNIKEVRLLDRGGEEVKTISLNNLDLRPFELTDFESNQYTGVSANGRSMQVVKLGDAEAALELRFFIFTESGTIHPDVAPQKVNLGDVRVDVIMRHFTDVCSNCSNIAALDLVSDIYGKEDEEIKTKLQGNSVDIITISKGAKFVFTDQVRY